MVDLEGRGAGAPPARATAVQPPAVATDIDQLPAMFGRIGDDVMAMLDAKLGLLKLELKEEARVYTRTAAMIAVGGVLAAVGFAFLNTAVAVLISTPFASLSAPLRFAVGFLVPGGA